MSLSRRFLPLLWVAALPLALGFLVWTTCLRIGHIERLNSLAGTTPVIDATSPTGYAGGVRMLLAPGHNNESYQWIIQTQQMLATGQWRLRQADYDNAPIGRAVTTPSLYRWWLATVAWCDHRLSGRPLGLSVEKAALWADPLLFMLLLGGGTLLAVRRFGPLTAAVFPLASVTIYPFGGAFLPGCPDDVGLALVLLAACALALLAGILPTGKGEARPKRWFIASGIFGGIGLWLNVSTFVPLLLGLGAGGLLGSWLARRNPAAALPWRVWGCAGAGTTFAAWLIEYAPAHLDLAAWRLHEVHPLYACAWLGGAELLALITAWMRGTSLLSRRTDQVRLALAVLALAAVPAVMLLKGTAAFLAENTFAFRLTALDDVSLTRNLAVWIVREGASWRLLALGLPLIVAVVVAGRRFWQRETGPLHRLALGLAFGPVPVAFVFGCTQLSWWNPLDALLLVLLVAATASTPEAEPAKSPPGWRLLGVALLLIPGVISLLPGREKATEAGDFSRPELEGLVEREFAHWLARRMGSDGALVLAPPNLAASLYFHGGLRGLGSPYRENEAGFQASVRLAAAFHADEAQALARQRNLTHIIIPSWDDFLDEYARLGSGQADQTLMGMLHSWLPPRWLRPVPYYLPRLKEFEDDRLLVFEMTEVQDHANALCRLTEYFLDMGQFELAAMAVKTLATDYAADLGAQITKARTEIARRDQAGFEQSLAAITLGLQDSAIDSITWDRRVTLSLVLAEGGRMEPARAQAQRCLDEMGELDLRSLSEATLFRFLTLCKVLGLQIQDEQLRDLSKNLLPPALRDQV